MKYIYLIMAFCITVHCKDASPEEQAYVKNVFYHIFAKAYNKEGHSLTDHRLPSAGKSPQFTKSYLHYSCYYVFFISPEIQERYKKKSPKDIFAFYKKSKVYQSWGDSIAFFLGFNSDEKRQFIKPHLDIGKHSLTRFFRKKFIVTHDEGDVFRSPASYGLALFEYMRLKAGNPVFRFFLIQQLHKKTVKQIFAEWDKAVKLIKKNTKYDKNLSRSVTGIYPKALELEGIRLLPGEHVAELGDLAKFEQNFKSWMKTDFQNYTDKYLP